MLTHAQFELNAQFDLLNKMFLFSYIDFIFCFCNFIARGDLEVIDFWFSIPSKYIH